MTYLIYRTMIAILGVDRFHAWLMSRGWERRVYELGNGRVLFRFTKNDWTIQHTCKRVA